MTTELSRYEAVKYLRDSAIRAHLDGQGAKARQLAALALRKEANRGGIPIVHLEDLAWAFFLMIYWMLEEEDFSIVLDGAWESFTKKHSQSGKTKDTSNDDYWRPVLKFLIDVLRPDYPAFEADIKALEEIPRSFFADREDKFTNEIICMILPLAIGYVRYICPDHQDGPSNAFIWHSLCKRWESHASQIRNKDLLQALITTRERMEKQHACILSSDEFPSGKEITLEEFWNAFYKIDIANMKKLRPRLAALTKLTETDTNGSYPIQSLINMTRNITTFTEERDTTDSLPGAYRIQRLYMENPQWLFGRLRSMIFSEVLNDAYFEAKKTGTTGINAVQLWRLPLIAEIIALQNWDLGNYLGSLKMQSKAWLFLGLLPVDHQDMTPADCNAEDLSTGIYQAIKGLALTNKKGRHFNDVERAVHNMELNESAKNKIDALLDSIIKSRRPIELRGMVNLFSIMGDAIPKDFMADVFSISIAAFSEKNNGFDLTMLNWWVDVFQWVDLDKAHWDIIDPFLTNLVHNHVFWNISNAMLTEALIKAPEDFAERWASTIAESRNKEELNKYGGRILYNASLERSELIKYSLRILDFLGKDPALVDQMAYDRALLLAADEDRLGVSETPEGKKLKMAFIEQLFQYAQTVANRTAKQQVNIMGFSRREVDIRQFRRISWITLDQNEWTRIDQAVREAIDNPYRADQDFLSLLLIWSIIASQQKKTIVDETGKWLIDLCRKSQSDSEMPFIEGVKDTTRYVKTAALSRFLHRVSSPICNDMLSWIQDEIPETEEVNLPTLWEMLSALYITGTRTQPVWALNALKAIYARTATNTDRLTEIMVRTFNVFITPHGQKKGKRLADILKGKKDVGPVLDTLDKVIGKLVQTPDPDGRKAAAMVLNLFTEMGWINEQRGKWIEKLKNDPRARVFSVFKT